MAVESVEPKGRTRTEVLLSAVMLLLLRPMIEEGKRGSVEGLLYRAGFTNKEIVELTGTPKSTVSERLKVDGLRE